MTEHRPPRKLGETAHDFFARTEKPDAMRVLPSVEYSRWDGLAENGDFGLTHRGKQLINSDRNIGLGRGSIAV